MCETVRFPGGGTAIVCGVRRGRRKCAYRCGRDATKLCDGPLAGASADSGATCDKPICGTCAVHVPPDRDYCREHAGGRGQGSMF